MEASAWEMQDVAVLVRAAAAKGEKGRSGRGSGIGGLEFWFTHKQLLALLLLDPLELLGRLLLTLVRGSSLD